MNIVALQTKTVAGNPIENYARTSRQIRNICPTPDLVLLPELSSPGYDDHVLDHKEEFAEDAYTGPSFQCYSQLACETGISIGYGILRKHADSEAISISHVVVAPDTSPTPQADTNTKQAQIIAVYDKIHLCQIGK